jgi:DnaJ-class molecular chaperone
VEKGGRMGDLYVEVRLEVPEEMTSESRKLMEALAAESALKY